MNALSSAGGGGHGAALHHLAKGCESAVAEFLAPSSGPNKRKRRPAGTPDPGAEVVALSPKTLMESDRYVCEICNQGFQRDQNLQMHRRRHKVPWKLLKKTSSLGTNNKRVYICPERSCLHHDPTHALGDLVGIKKHFRRKHCTDKQWKCVKCSKRYAVQSDYKAHLKTCGTRGHCCDCGRVFSRVESFIEHQDTCSAVKRKTTQNSSLLHHHNADRLIFSSDSPSQSSDTTTQAISFPQSGLSAADTADNISMTKRMDVEHPRGRNQVHPEVPVLMSPAAMPSWLVTERRNELELLPSSSMQRVPGVPHLGVRTPGSSTDQASHGSISSASQVVPSISCPNAKSSTDLNQLCEEEMHTPCLRLSIGPASSSSTTEMVASCSSPRPSQHVDLRKPRFISAIGNETLALSSSHQRHEASIGVLTSRVDRTCSSHPAAIGKDLALSIPEPPNHTMEVPSNHAGSTLSDFLARAAWLKQMAKSKSKFYQSMEFRLQNNRESGFNEA